MVLCQFNYFNLEFKISIVEPPPFQAIFFAIYPILSNRSVVLHYIQRMGLTNFVFAGILCKLDSHLAKLGECGN